MQRKILNGAEKYAKSSNRRRFWNRLVSGMACVVVFFTTYALILPAITMETPTSCMLTEHTHEESCYRQLAELSCPEETEVIHVHSEECYGMPTAESASEVHTHDDNCYTLQQGELTCQIPETEGHGHGEGCYIPGEQLVCQQEESEGHTHNGDCSQVQLTCTLPEDETHSHSETCSQAVTVCEIAESQGHTHTQDCYGAELSCTAVEEPAHLHEEACYAQEQVLTCTLEEAEPVLICTEPETQAHVHSEACAQPAEQTCVLEEDENHAHSFLCYGQWELVCGLEEHTHVLICFSDPEADVENETVWAKMFEDEELTGVWAEDVLTIADTQLGYAESEKNYEVLEDGQTMKGYTRYGAWYGDPYGDWAGMFASFCIRFAGVTEEAFPVNADYEDWIEALDLTEEEQLALEGDDEELKPEYETDLFFTPEEYQPKPGDVVFFDLDEDEIPDHAALVSELVENYEEPEEPEAAETTEAIETIETFTISETAEALTSAAPTETAETTETTESAETTENTETTEETDATESTETEAAEENEPNAIKVIEGDSENAVRYETYKLDDEAIVGYGALPEKPGDDAEETEATEPEGVLYTYSDDEVYVEVVLPEDTEIPEDAVLKIEPIADDADNYASLMEKTAEAVDGTVTKALFYDISFYTPEGEYISVSDTAKVAMAFKESPVSAASEVKVLHFDQEETPQVLEDVTFQQKDVEIVQEDTQQTDTDESEQETENKLVSEAPLRLLTDLFGLTSASEETTPAATEAAEATETTETTEATEATTPVTETVTEYRTVIEFTTEGFSTFAVVEVEVPAAVTVATKNLYNANDTYNDLDGKIVVISNYNADDDKYYALVGAADVNNEAYTQVEEVWHDPAGATAIGDIQNITISTTDIANKLWRVTRADENSYYFQCLGTGRWLKICSNAVNQNMIALEQNQIDNCKIQVINQANVGYMVLRRDNAEQCYLRYDPGYGAFTGIICADNNGAATKIDGVETASMVISEYIAPADELDGETLALVSVRDAGNNPLHVVTPNTDINGIAKSEQVTAGLRGIALGGNAKLNTTSVITQITNAEIAQDNYWTFEAVDYAPGQYYVKSPDGKYMQISNAGATLVDEPNPIAVETGADNGYAIIKLKDVGTNMYLNRFGGTDNLAYAGFTDGNDDGAFFVLARQVGFKATVLSREELHDAAKMPNAQLIFFVRQTVDGVDRYYAINADGTAQEIYLESDTLADNAIVYTTTTDATIRWDATSTPNAAAGSNGMWNGSNNVDGAIDLMPKNMGKDVFLSPNMDGGYGGNNKNAALPNYRNLAGQQSITSEIESADNGSPWYKDENRSGSPLRANHNASFYKIADDSTADFDPSIANVIMSNFAGDNGYDDDDTTKTESYCRVMFNPTEKTFYSGELSTYGAKKAEDNFVVYVAQVDTAELLTEEIDTETENLVGQILTREEFQDAAKEYGDNWPFMIIAKNGDNYYALDSHGIAQPVEFIKDNTLEAGGRFIFQKKNAVTTGYTSSAAGEIYNPNRILWDPTATQYNSFATNEFANGWVELWMSNLATKQYLSPSANGLTSSSPVEGEFNPGFFYSNEKNDGLSSYLAARLGETVDGATADPDRYIVKLDSANRRFEVLNQWGKDANDDSLNNDLDGNTDTEFVFYVAMLVDRDVTYDNTTKTVKEYEHFHGVNENVRMHVFNYGAAIDLYGQYYNKSDIEVDLKPGVANGWLDYGNDLLYRFFYRPDFDGEVIDGTNDPNNNNNAGGTANGRNLYSDGSDPFDDGARRVFANKLIKGYPAIKLPVNWNKELNEDGTATDTDAQVTAQNDYNNYFSLGYLFNPDGFVPNTVSEVNQYYSSLVISDSSENGDLHAIVNDGSTAINSENGKTPGAGSYDPAYNPNYAVQSYPVGDGSKTGLFQKDANGYYYYDSKVNAAFYNEDDQLFELYNYALIPGSYNGLDGGNFLPFNNGNTQGRLVTPEQFTANEGEVLDRMNGQIPGTGNAALLPTLTKADRYYRLNGFQHDDDTTIGRNSMADLWLGMYMEIDFTMTEDGKIRVTREHVIDGVTKELTLYERNNGYANKRPEDLFWCDENDYDRPFYSYQADLSEPRPVDSPAGATQVRNELIFHFEGDDDVLVYVDDVLVMNMNGIHGVWTGNINFATGVITNDQYGSAADAETNNKTIRTMFEIANTDIDGYVFPSKSGNDDDTNENTFAANSDHTLKFFYLERGGNISDCAISFNLEPKQRGGLTVTKRVEGLDREDGDDDLLPDEQAKNFDFDGEYTFQLVDLVQAFDNNVEGGGIVDEVPYEIVRNDGGIEEGFLKLHHQTRVIDGTEYQVCRYYHSGLDVPLTDEQLKNFPNAKFDAENKYIEIFRAQGGDFYFYTKNDVFTPATNYKLPETQDDTFFYVYDSDKFTLKHDETANFVNFLTGTLVKVKEYPTNNGVELGTTFWWQLKDIDNDGVQDEGEYQVTPGADGSAISPSFKISNKTALEIVCRNILQPVNLGIRKVLYNSDGTTVSLDNATEFEITYELTYPTSAYMVEQDGTVTQGDQTVTVTKLYKTKVENDKLLNGVADENQLLRNFKTNTWDLRNGATYGTIVDTKEGLDSTDFTPAGTATDAPDEDYFMWTVNVPFGSYVEIKEILVKTENGTYDYDVSWDYQRWNALEVPVDASGNIITVTNNGVATVADADTQSGNVVYNNSLNAYVATKDIINDGVIIEEGDVLIEAVKDANGAITGYKAPKSYGILDVSKTYANKEEAKAAFSNSVFQLCNYELATRYVPVDGWDVKTVDGATVYTPRIAASADTDSTTDLGNGFTTGKVELLATDNYFTIYNTPRPDITVTKAVVKMDGTDLENVDKEFTFNYWLKNADEKYIDHTGKVLEYEGDKPAAYTLTLKDDSSVVIQNVPIGSTIEIEETATSAAGYATSFEVYSRYEAENAVYANGADDVTVGYLPSGAYVGAIGDDDTTGGSVAFAVSTATAESHTLRLNYNTSGARDFGIKVNDGDVQSLACASSGSAWGDDQNTITSENWQNYWEEKETTAQLARGTNTITISGDGGGYAPNLDYLDIMWQDGAGVSVEQTGIMDSIVIDFTNATGYELPNTGGAGTYLYTMGGLMLTLAAAILLYSKTKRGKEELASS